MANLPLPKSGAALVAAMAGVSDVIKAKGMLWSLCHFNALHLHQHALKLTESRVKGCDYYAHVSSFWQE